jgi:hypothetical protein
MTGQALFNDALVWREHSQWKAVFADPVSIESNGQAFANFGDIFEIQRPEIGYETIVDAICEGLTSDIFQEIRREITVEPLRGVHTASGDRKRTRPIATHPTQRMVRTNHAQVPKSRIAPRPMDRAPSRGRLVKLP